MKARRFTLEAVDWTPWLEPVTPDTATPAQREALEASPQANSAYFRTLANDVDSLAERSPLFHAVMYVPRGLKRAERELATVVTSIINGCVYCSSVHARRFVELTKQPDIIRALYDQGLDTPLEPRLRAIVDYAAKLTREPGGDDRRRSRTAARGGHGRPGNPRSDQCGGDVRQCQPPDADPGRTGAA